MKQTMNLSAALVGLTLGIIAMIPTPCFANNDSEKARLIALINELEALKPLISEAEDHAWIDTRIHLNYTWLRQDLERIKSGIRDYIDTPSTEPRSFAPLTGNYRQ